MNIILGSASPRRKQLLSELGLVFTVHAAQADETPSPGLVRGEMALDIARKKAEHLKIIIKENDLLITSDTIVWIDNYVLNKPENEEEAFAMLTKLNGRKHQVYTGVCLFSHKKEVVFSCKTDVVFRKVTDDTLQTYISNYRPFDKAGSYGAQECLPEGINFCSEIEKAFLQKIGKPDLFEKTLAGEKGKHVPMIDYIEGSYFNVMGLPIVEVMEALKNF